MKLKGDEVVLELGDRRYRIRGLAKNTSYESLKVNVLATREGLDERVFMDTFDLALAKQRASFEKQTTAELGVREEVIHHDMGQVLKALEILREKQIEKALAPKAAPVVISPEEHAEAMHLLRSPDLVQKIVTAFDRCGLVGERTNKLVAYLAAVSRKLDDPLAVIVQSSSAAGKTALMDAVLALMPKEERVRYSAMTGKALFYITETSLKHKILAISEEEGAEQASYALKLLQSEGELTIASTGKDPATGKLVTQEYHIEGPVMIIVTTTKIDIDEELLNRCIVLTVDENREQTRAIHQVQREMQTLEGLLAKKGSDHIRRVHQNAQRLLKPVHVVNPYARELTFLDARTRTRRDHMKYLTLIRSVALLHQFQRPRKSAGEGESRIEYIEVTREDIALANGLAHEVLGRSLDELPPQTRRLLHLVDDFVTAECRRLHMKRVTFRFSRRHIREWTGWGDTQLKVHLHRLEELEYLLVHRGGRGQSFVYEMLYDGEGRERTTFLSGLIDVAKLGEPGAALANRSGLEEEKSGSTGEKSGSGRPLVAPESGVGRGGQTEVISNPVRQLDPGHVETSLDALLRDDRRKTVSYILKSRKDGNGRDTTPRAFFRRDRVNVIRALQRKRNEQP
jgi:DNA primase